ncbi:MAG: InlB B-repeat-containing protein [Oscillospiraceae bacterium]|nr:InlB B-repeat-containing protein [Oscillospiraceae bacterium]
MANCTISSWKYCSKGASSWTNSGSPTSVTLYAGGSYVACVTFTTPSFQGTSKQVSLKFNVVRISGGNTSTSLYCKIGTVNPGSTPLDPYSDSAVGALSGYTTMSCSGITYNSQQFTHTFTFNYLQPNKTYYLWIYGGAGIQLYKHSSYNVISIDSMNQTYAPTSVTRSVSYSGFYGDDQSFTAKSSTAGYYFVTTGTPTSSTAKWYKRQTSTSNATSCTFVVDKDTTTTSLYKTYHLTVIPNYPKDYTGASSNYKTFYAPRFAFKGYVNSSTAVEINSYDYSSLTSPKTISGYTFLGWSSSSTSTSVANSSGASWATSLNNVTRYAVYKKQGSTVTVTLNANGGSISSTSATKTISDAYIYGKGSTSGGTASYSNGSLNPTRDGYEFLGWGVDGELMLFQSPKDALDAGYYDVTLVASWRENRGLRVFNSDSASSLYIAYIYNGSSWDYYIPYVYDGSSWQEMG